ncbi:hypothetical protein CRP13_gp21 [Roseobacter phage CRP-13]|nr:hypothetical protein CRP13_gp21 [Roseobacter phage CRP-13]
MSDTTPRPQNNVHLAIIANIMVETGLTWQDIVLIVQRHLNDVEFERDLAEVYEGDEWGDWVEGDIV